MTNLPYIICHMMTSLDGKISFGKVNGQDTNIYAFGDYMPIYNSTEAKLGIDALMCGRVTMQEFEQEDGVDLSKFATPENLTEDYIVKADNEEYFIVVDTKGLLRWKNSHLKIGVNQERSLRLITLVTKNTSKEYLSYLKSRGISYIIAGADELDFKEALSRLKEKFEIERIALEGGGGLNGSMLNEHLIDEISLLLIPIVINNQDAPSISYKQIINPQLHKLKLKHFEQLENDMLWMRYVKN